MNLFVGEIITPPPAHLPISVSDEQKALARAVVEEVERTVLWRGIVEQRRRIIVDGPLAPRLTLEPITDIVSLTRWTAADNAEVIPASTYNFVTRDPAGTIIIPAEGMNWPAPERSIGSFELTYECGWDVAPESTPGAGDAINNVPASVQLMVERAISFRAGAGLGNIEIGSLKLDVAPSYSTDALPREITDIARAFQYRPGIFAAKP